jgi:signal transduction histidine kinase
MNSSKPQRQIPLMSDNQQLRLSAQQKAAAALEAARGVKSTDEIAHQYGVDPGAVRHWEQVLIRNAASLFGADGMASAADDAALASFDPPPSGAPRPCLMLAPDLTIVGASAPYLQSATQRREDIVGRHIFDVFPHDPRVPGKKSMRARKQLLGKEASTRLSQLTSGQMQINEALVFKIFECQRVEEALQQSKNRLQQLLAHQEQIKEEERKRIAREIHDDLGQNLLALRIDISMLHARTAQGHPHLHQWVGVVLGNIDATIKSVRSIINDLRPFELELGLQAAVEWQLKGFERISGVACRLTIDDAMFDDAIGDEQTLAIFRILQESLSNIARHSRATEAEVTLSRHHGTLTMEVRDNGVGTSSDDKRKANSFGIVGIRERVTSLGGRLTINGGGGKGTVLSINIPVKQWK